MLQQAVTKPPREEAAATNTRRVLGVAMAAAGAAILAGMGYAIYDRQASRLMVDVGIPGCLLITLAGLVLLFGGGALALSRRPARR